MDNRKRIATREFCVGIIVFIANVRYCCIGQILTEVSQFLNVVILLPVVVFALVSILLNILTKKELLKIFTLLLLSSLIFLFSNQTAILVSTITLVSMKDFSIDKIIKLDMIYKILIVIIVAVLMVLGIIPDNQRTESLMGIKLVAHSMGFRSVNTLGLIILIILIEYAYIHRCKIKTQNLLLILFVGLIFSGISSSRSLFVGHILLVILLFIYFNLKKYRIPFWALFLVSLPFIFFSYFYNELPFVKSLDSLMSGRIWLGYAYFQLYPFSLFGNVIHYGFERYNGVPITLDNFYIRAIVNFGFLYFLLYFFAFILKMIRNNKSTNITGDVQNIVIFLIFVCSVAESYYFNLFFNPALFFLVSLMFSKPDKEEDVYTEIEGNGN